LVGLPNEKFIYRVFITYVELVGYFYF